MDSILYILTGYTAVGKTSLSLDWARRNNAEIVSCDSLLFYKNMDVGTAKPTHFELAEVPHHLINVVEPSIQYSIKKYSEAVKKVISDIHARGKRVLIVGGSGFYLNSFFIAVVDGLKIDPLVQMRIENQFENQSLEASVEILKGMNPGGLGDLDIENPRRVLKAWLRCIGSGKSLEELRRDFDKKPGEFDSFQKKLLVLSRPREELHNRVASRVNAMLSAGLVEEVRGLISLGIERNPSAAQAIGYRETIAYLKGELSEGALGETIVRNTRKLLKKQRTWFNKFLSREAVIDVSNVKALPDDWYSVAPRKTG
ncbi:MAG: tRNA (adenosine(37)-N6)-dimethylallyltransferase MiaA [Verrucomicrobia bacterium]|nr:tRNA (adenosine(37)-N6)-dimethylallyltransferase MiaA [Verrucomicrobiota bacterium]MDA1066586.1 tRNA (adenosine(37)-N6)-dimethylallyltransferase MiaA [Verrucomicrobiota bacterium]